MAFSHVTAVARRCVRRTLTPRCCGFWQDVPSEVLERFFHNIKENEIRMNEGDQWEGEVVTFMAPNKSGWLSKQNHGGFMRWKKHWFVLSEHVLYYFDRPGDEKPRFILPMDDIRVGIGKDDLTLTILNVTGGRLKCTKILDDRMELQNYKEFTMKAATKEERNEWFQALKDETEPDPVQKKKREIE